MVKVSDFSLVCRLCAKAYRIEKLVKIFSTRGTSLNLKASINAHLPIKVTEKDDLPLNICIMCLRKVNATNEFFDTVTASDKLFIRLLKKKENKKSVRSKEQTYSSSVVIKTDENVNKKEGSSLENNIDIIRKTKCLPESNPVQDSSEKISYLSLHKVKKNNTNYESTSEYSNIQNKNMTNSASTVEYDFNRKQIKRNPICNTETKCLQICVTDVLNEDSFDRETKNLVSLIQNDKMTEGSNNIDRVNKTLLSTYSSKYVVVPKASDIAMHDGTNYMCSNQNNTVVTNKSDDSIQNTCLNTIKNNRVTISEANSVLICYKDCNIEFNSSNAASNDTKIHEKLIPEKNNTSKSESMFLSKADNFLVLDQPNNVKLNDTSGQVCQKQSPSCNDSNKNEYIVVHKPNNILADGSNDITFEGSNNIVIGVTSNVSVTPKNPVKIPMEVLRCPDCDESVKVFSLEERRLFYAYLKQHSCKKVAEMENNIYKYHNKSVVETFAEYREKYEVKKRKRGKNREMGEAVKSCTRVWPAGDLPADPGPDPVSQEDIFENDVRLDDDFHWPMPKRNRRMHRCNSCDFITKSAVRLRSHQKLHRLDKKQNLHSASCLYCYKQFETSVEARKHEKLIHIAIGAKNSLCEYCGLTKPQKKLRDHILKQHTVQSDIEMQECDVCGKLCISSTSLYLHKKIHTTDQQHLCDLCGKAFQQRITMRRHYLLHFPRAPPKFICDICDKRVTTRGSLRLHMMRHTGEKPQKCPECHVVMRHGLKHHMRLHSDEAPFKCVVCDANFKRRDYIRRHMRKHLNDRLHRTFHCTTCSYAFDDIKNFLIHQRDVHCNEIFTQMKNYDCKNCKMQFTDSSRCKDHEDACSNLQQNTRNKLYTDVDHTMANDYSKTCTVEDLQKNCETNVIGTYTNRACNCVGNTSVNYDSCMCSSDTCQNNPCMIHGIRSCVNGDCIERNSIGTCTNCTSGNHMNCTDTSYVETNNVYTDHTCISSKTAKIVVSDEKISSLYNFKFSQNRDKSGEEVRRTTKKLEEPIPQSNEHTSAVLSEQVLNLDSGAEYAYMNVDKQVRSKDELLTVDEIIVNNSVHGYDSHMESFTNSSHQQIQTQLCLPHLSNITYTSESLSWKQL